MTIDPSLVELKPGELGQFMQSLKAYGAGFLMLDYDGTLAPFHVDRYRAYPSPGILERLTALQFSGKTRIAFVTGRPCREVPPLMPLPHPYEIWGCHGREYQRIDGHRESFGVTAADEAMLEEAAALSRAIARGGNVERKIGCCAIHWRPLDDVTRGHIAADAKVAWAPFVESGRMQIEVFDGGIEMSVAGRSKGDAVAHLLTTVEDPRLPIAFLGDDWTDENGFRVLSGRGFPVLVRADERETVAPLRVTLPKGVIRFLDLWMEALGVFIPVDRPAAAASHPSES